MKDVQQAFVDEGAVQCGFCIPGMALSSYHLLQNNPQPDQHAIKQALSGNICRCTGYMKIEAAVKKAAEIRRNKK
jgi:carbon-monoxide dehydrogenase small subunit